MNSRRIEFSTHALNNTIDIFDVNNGIDVSAKPFIEEISVFHPDVEELSGSLAPAFGSMKEKIKAFDQFGGFEVMICSQIDETVRASTDADPFGVNAVGAVNLCHNWMGVVA